MGKTTRRLSITIVTLFHHITFYFPSFLVMQMFFLGILRNVIGGTVNEFDSGYEKKSRKQRMMQTGGECASNCSKFMRIRSVFQELAKDQLFRVLFCEVSFCSIFSKIFIKIKLPQETLRIRPGLIQCC